MKYSLLIILLLFVALIGCSSINNPTSNQSDLYSDIASIGSNNLIPVGVSDYLSQDAPAAGSGLLGLFNIFYDSDTKTAEINPLRNNALFDVLEMVDITHFLQLAPCIDCVKLMGIEFDSNENIENIILKIGIKHPFDPGDPFKPITGRNRGDLHVFNVEGTVIFNDSSQTTSFPSLGKTIGKIYLVNADGYSSYLNQSISDFYPTSITLHPYILHFDDYSEGNFDPNNPMGFESVTIPPPSGNLVMPMGSDYDIKDYHFSLSGDESFNFLFVVGCTYAVSAASKSVRFAPEFRVPQHNKKAASEVHVEFTSNNLRAGIASSSAEIAVKVLDMNHGVSTGDALDQMKADSSVSAVSLEVPGVTNGLVSGSTTPVSGNGRDPEDPLTFLISFSNDLAAGDGIFNGLVKVLDSYPTALNESPLLNSMDGIKRVDPLVNPLQGLYAISEFSTYRAFTIEITDINRPPVPSFTTDPSGTPNLSIGFLDTVTFTSTSYDPDDPSTPEGQIVKYEWDFYWDGDPSNFVDYFDGSGTEQVSHKYERIAGVFKAGLRVTDNGSPPMVSDIYSIEIDVYPWSKDFIVDSDNSRIPKIAQMNSGKMMLIWSNNDTNRTQYSTFDGSWDSKSNVSDTIATTQYLSLDIGPGENEAWASGGIYFFHYTGNPGPWTKTEGEIGSCVQTHVFSDGLEGFNILQNSSSSFGWVVRIYWENDYSYYANISYESIHYIAYNNRLLGESRIIDRNSLGNVLHVHKQDLAIDPYRPHQDYRYLVFARTYDPTQTGYFRSPIAEGADDVLDSVTIACDTTDKIHVAYRNQPDGGGNYSVLYKSSGDHGVSWSSPETIFTGPNPPEYDYVSIDTDSLNNILVTYCVDNNSYWISSTDGITWSATEIINESWPGGSTKDKEQFMVIDSNDRTHVTWNRCLTGSVGYGPIYHRVRAPWNQ